MAFTDRIVEYPGRYTLTNADTGTVLGTFDLARAEGEIYDPGTLLNANNLNAQTQLDDTVQSLFETAGMTSGTYQNEGSDAAAYLLEKIAPNFLQASMTSDQTLSTAGSTITLNLNNVTRRAGNKLSLNTTNHRLIVGAGVSYVRVSGQIYIPTVGTAGSKNVYIYQNDTIRIRALANLSNNYNTIVVPPCILPVAENDYFTLRAQSQNGTTTVVSRESYSTFLLVEVIG